MTATQVITCDCSHCQGRSAEVRGQSRLSATVTHNLVCLAYSPFRRAQSQIRFGPWAVSDRSGDWERVEL